MATITFDTLAYVKTLREAGFTEPQAEAQASALANVLRSGAGELATKQDLRELALATKQDIEQSRELVRQDIATLRKDVAVIEERFKLLHWMIGFNLLITSSVMWMLIKGAH